MQPFEETQILNPIYTIVVFVVLIALSTWLWKYFNQIVNKQLLVIGAVIYLIIAGTAASFSLERLDTRIDEAGIHYRYFPGFLKTRDIKWNELYVAEISEFKPWYMETSRGAMASYKHSNQFVISGESGLRIILLDGTQLILGTQRPAEMRKYLQNAVAAGIINKEQFPD